MSVLVLERRMKTALIFMLSLGIVTPTMAIVGGRKAAQVPVDKFSAVLPEKGLFPAQVLIADCTSTKIAEQAFALAAHCVVDSTQRDESNYVNQLLPAFEEGTTLRFDRKVHHKADQWSHEARIIRTLVHPAYRYSGSLQSWLKPQAISDIAVIIIDKKTPEIPIMEIDDAPLAVGDEVIKMGYGCPEIESGKIIEWVVNKERELTYELSKVVTAVDSIARYYQSLKKSAQDLPYYSEAPRQEFIAGSFNMTKGKFHKAPPAKKTDQGDPKEVSLGFSDSGGPLLVKRGKVWKLAGINAKSLLWPKEEHHSGLEPVALDLHTRVDKENFSGTNEWLKEVISLSIPALKKKKVVGARLSVALNREDLTAKKKDKIAWFPSENEEGATLREYLRSESKIHRLSITTPTGAPCPLTLERVTVHDLNSEDDPVWAIKPEKDEDELSLKSIAPGVWELKHSDLLLVESARFGFSLPLPESKLACLIRLE